MGKTKKSSTKYANVFKIGKNSYRATKMVKGVRLQPRGKSARQATRRLNAKCRDLGAPLPNPKVGCEKSTTYNVKGGRPTNFSVKVGKLHHCGIEILPDWRVCPKCCTRVIEFQGSRIVKVEEL